VTREFIGGEACCNCGGGGGGGGTEENGKEGSQDGAECGVVNSRLCRSCNECVSYRYLSSLSEQTACKLLTTPSIRCVRLLIISVVGTSERRAAAGYVAAVLCILRVFYACDFLLF
jgi:hypothetical protein